MIRTTTLSLLALLGLACVDSSVDDGAGGASAATAYAGSYEVPVPPELAAAATYPVAEIEWSVVGGVATLEYDLPLGLVGTKVRVSFTGPVEGTNSKLTGPVGTADCTIGDAAVSCLENMDGLLPLATDMAVVEQVAATEYAGPVVDRVDIAKRFQGDPIGIVHVDLTRAVVVDDPVGSEKD